MKFSTSLLLILPALCAASRHIDGGLDCRTDAQQGTLKCSEDYDHVMVCGRGPFFPERLEWIPFLYCADIGFKCDWISHRCVPIPTQDTYFPGPGN